MTEITIIDRDIAPNEVFKHTGPVRITGCIGAGATVVITEGELTVDGHVNSNATVDIKGANTNHGSMNIIGGNVISMSGGNYKNVSIVNGVVTIDGQVVTGNVGGGGNNATGNITVNGGCGNDVNLKSTNNVVINLDCGDRLRVDCANNFTSHGNIGAHADIDCGNNAGVVGVLGAYSKLDAGNNAGISDVQANCVIDTGNNFDANYVRSNCHIDAGNNLNVRFTAHQTASLDEGNKLRVGKYVTGDDTPPPNVAPAPQTPPKPGRKIEL